LPVSEPPRRLTAEPPSVNEIVPFAAVVMPSGVAVPPVTSCGPRRRHAHVDRLVVRLIVVLTSTYC
jgi:hypothetical protein